jgi:membrane-associated phospholipid phosphatase
VARGLLVFLVRDLREALAAGFQRTPPVSPGGSLWLVRWALVSALVGLTLFLFCGYHAGFLRLNALAARLPELLWESLTILGDERVAFTLTLFFTRRRPRVFWTLVAAALLGFAFTHSLKPLLSASRPPAALEPGTFHLIGPGHHKESFPSGHTVTAAIFFGVWTYYARSAWLRALLVLIAVLAGLSRVAVGVHWPVDVAAGLAGGLMSAWLGVLLARRGQRVGTSPFIHLALVALAAAMAVSLLLWDGHYPGAASMQRILAAAALGYAAFTYAIGPTLRWLRSRA